MSGLRRSGAERFGRKPTIELEKSLGFPDVSIAGVDEVGRGCLAGPVVAGAVLMPRVSGETIGSFFESSPPWLGEVADSKLLQPSERERLEPLIQGWVGSYSIGIATVEEIDRLNIHHATLLAMSRAIAGLRCLPDRILVDGKFSPPEYRSRSVPVVKGDRTSISIACASVLAKAWRDRRMQELDKEFPEYGFERHKGYSTPAHLEALRKHGPCSLHRTSFSPVRDVETSTLL